MTDRTSISPELQAALNRMWSQAMGDLYGTAQQAQWHCEDGWIVIYTTSRVKGGQHDGKFLVQEYKPYGKGARGGKGKPMHWKVVYERSFATRKAAKKRALVLYGKHSPKWAERNLADWQAQWAKGEKK